LKKHGITLIELIVVVALVGVFSIFVFMLFHGGRSAQSKVSSDLYMQSRALAAQNEVSRIIREGREFIAPALNEKSPLLCFINKTGDISLLCIEKDKKLSETIGKDLFELVFYEVKTESFNISMPATFSGKSRTITRFIKDVNFKLANTGSVNVEILFANEKSKFQILFQCGLMNSEDLM
jgi:prepilin-type N-terminal cleavage/methylation domain-containing protein